MSEILGTLVKTSLVDYPGRVAAALFLCGCNLRCPYCYNALLVRGTLPAEEGVDFETVISYLERRRNVLSGFVISGGEPLLCPRLPHLIALAKSLGYRVKLDTNGMLGAKLAALLGSPESRPDFVALDLKTSPRRYRDFSGAIPDPESELFRSIGLVSGLPPESREFRTVLVPGLVGLREITEIAALIPKDAAWFFAPFRNQGCLDPAYNDVPPYSDGEAQDLVSAAAALIPGARLR